MRASMSSLSSSFAALVIATLVVACSSDEPSGAGLVGPTVATDAAVGGEDSGSQSEADAGAFASCAGACAKTTLTVSYQGKSVALTRAQFGIPKSQGGKIFHVEAHDGGSSACPTQSSPSPDRTLVIEDVPAFRDTTDLGSNDGVRAAFFDFAGTLLPDTPLAKATNVVLHPVARAQDPSGKLTAIALDVDMTFPQGMTLKGHLFAEHCDSMDE